MAIFAPYKRSHYWSLGSWEAFKEMLKWCEPWLVPEIP